MDNEELFIPLKDLGLKDIAKLERREDIPINAKTTDLTSYNIAAERQFKLDVLEWLTNGKPKLFRSPTEGNYIVRLLNTSLTPTDTLGRMIHSFSSTAYEIDDCTYDNLGVYGFVSGEEIANDAQRLRFRTVYLRDLVPTGDEIAGTEIYKFDDNGYIEVLINPYGNHSAITAQSVHIEDCEYGDKFLINYEPITIGATQSYNIDNMFPIESVKFKPSDIAALGREVQDYTDVVYNPMITYSYYDTFSGTSLFDNITEILVGTEPARQFMKNNTTMYTDNIVHELENIKTTVVKYNYIYLEKRPVEEIYSIIDLSANASWRDMFLQTGFSDDTTINRLFTFDKTGWGRGRSSSTSQSITPNTNIVSGLNALPSSVLKNMPFYIFHVLPTTVTAQEVASQFKTYRSQILLGAQRVHITITTQDLLEKSEEELIGLFGDHIRPEDRTAIHGFKRLQENNPLTVGGFADEQVSDYFVTQDTVRNPKKTYYTLVSSQQGEDGIEDVFAVYYGALHDPNNPETPDVIVYEYGNVWVAANDELRNLYLSFDYDVWENGKDYYMYYDTKDRCFKLFDEGQYSTCAYINTGLLDGLPLDEDGQPLVTEYINLEDATQPAAYVDLDKITDMYIGNGLMVTLGYSYSTTGYKFETEPSVYPFKNLYESAVKNYHDAIESYNDTSYTDPADTWQPLINTAYANFINALTTRIEQWKEANEIDDI